MTGHKKYIQFSGNMVQSPLVKLYVKYIYIYIYRLSEVEQYRAVLRHPAFQKDPMSTISEHVRNTVATGAL